MVHHLVLTDGFSSRYRLMITKIALMIFHNGYMQKQWQIIHYYLQGKAPLQSQRNYEWNFSRIGVVVQ